jgi:hypothetical protein
MCKTGRVAVEAVELDEAAVLALVVAGDAGSDGELVTGAGGGEAIDLAAHADAVTPR